MKSLSPPENEPETLDTVYFSYRECTECACSANRKVLLRGTGNPNSPVLFVLDRLSPEDMSPPYRGFPSGGGGDALRTVMAYLGEDLDSFYVVPPAACPPIARAVNEYGRDLELIPYPEKGTLSACRPLLHRIIGALQPEVVVAMGPVAVQALSLKQGSALPPGRMHEILIGGAVSPYVVPTMVTTSAVALFRTPMGNDTGGLWAKTAAHIQQAIRIGRELRG